jgi:superfamily II DNA/RNA helicase
MSFSALGLNDFILRALADAGYQAPTPVQQQAVPAALAGCDLLVSSRTGSGKTAAFMLPSLHRLAEPARHEARGPRILVLTPTRELARQVADAAQKYGRHLRHAKVVSIVGGVAYPVQNRMLASRYEILVATPGRLIDQVQSGRIDFSRLEVLVLDEADRMLDMGFIEDIETIVARLPRERQTLLFSATLDGRITRLAGGMLNDPQRIEIAPPPAHEAQIEQRLLVADGLAHKNQLLDRILRESDLRQAIVFTATKRDADALAGDLEQTGFAAAALHGDMKQSQRNRTLEHLRRGRVRVLVATDVAARGLDVQGISHVINFDLPKSAEDYVHRIGRTGRAGHTGVAISLVGRNDYHQVKAIERYTRQPIPVHTIPGLEPKSGLGRPARRKPGQGKRWGDEERRGGPAPRRRAR